jgi:hypothetical protein
MARQELAKLRWDSEMIERLIDGLRKAGLDITGEEQSTPSQET